MNFTAKLSVHAETIFCQLKRDLGDKTHDFPSKFDLADFWGSTESIAHKLGGLTEEISEHVMSNTRADFGNKTEINQKIEAGMHDDHDLRSEINGLTSQLQSEAREWRKGLLDLDTMVQNLPSQIATAERFMADAAVVLINRIKNLKTVFF